MYTDFKREGKNQLFFMTTNIISYKFNSNWKQISSDIQQMSCGCAAVSTENFESYTSKITTKPIQYQSLEIQKNPSLQNI